MKWANPRYVSKRWLVVYLSVSISLIWLKVYWPSLMSWDAFRQPSYLSAGMSVLKASRLLRQSRVTVMSAPFRSINWNWSIYIGEVYWIILNYLFRTILLLILYPSWIVPMITFKNWNEKYILSSWKRLQLFLKAVVLGSRVEIMKHKAYWTIIFHILHKQTD